VVRREILTLKHSNNRKENDMKMIPQPYQQQQGAGGVIQKAKVLLVAVTDPCLYAELSPANKTAVDTIDAKGPADRTQADCNALVLAIAQANGC